jgi:flagellar motor switch protein FliG
MNAIHRIDDLLFELAFDSPSIGMARTDELRRLVLDKLLPMMETVFDQFGGDEMVWQIEKLVVDVGDVTEAELPAALAAGLRRALEQALHGADESPAAPGQIAGSEMSVSQVNQVSQRRGDVDALLAFLSDGTMQWLIDASAPASHETLLARVLAHDAKAFVQALAGASHRAVMLTRLTRQFGPAQLEELLRQLAPGRADTDLARLGALQRLLQDAGLSRTLWRGALHAAWEAVLTASLERVDGSPPLSAQRLTRNALNWLAQQQREDPASVATKLLEARASSHDDDTTVSDVLQALRRISVATSSVTAAEGRAFSTGDVMLNDVPAEWRALAGHPDDSALLARLVRQSSPATRQAMLRYFTPDHAHSLLAQLDALQGLLAGLPVSVPLSQSALAAAWQHLLGEVLARPKQLPATLPMLDEVIAVLAAEPTTAMQTDRTGTMHETQRRTLVLHQMREVAAVLGNPAGLATALMALERFLERQEAASSFSARPSSAVDVAPDIEPHPPQNLHEQSLPMAPIYSRLTALPTPGKTDDIDPWQGFQERQPELLRSTVRHYDGYAEIRERMASIFPRSLLRDMDVLLSPEAAALVTRIGDDESPRSSLSSGGADDAPDQAGAQAVAEAGLSVLPQIALNQAANDVPAEWRALAAGHADDSALLARLVRQSSPATRQAMLRYFTPDHAHSLLAQLDALQGLLAGLPVSAQLSQSALAAAWQHLLAEVLARPKLLPEILSMLDAVIAVLAAEPTTSTGAIPAAQRRALVLNQMREAAAVLNDPAGLATALMAIARMPGRQEAVSPVAADAVPDVELHAPQKLHEKPSAMAAIRSAVAAALKDGKADDIHDDWQRLADSQPGLSSEAAELMHDTGDDETLHSSLSMDGADDVPVNPQVALNQPTDDAPAEWRALVAGRADDSLLLARLVRQSSPATLQAMLRYFTPDHAHSLLAQLEALKRLMAGLSVSAQLSQSALSAAWQHLLGEVLARPKQLPATLPMLDAVIAVLAAEPTAAMPTDSKEVIPEAQRRALVLSQMREVAVELNESAGLTAALMTRIGDDESQRSSLRSGGADEVPGQARTQTVAEAGLPVIPQISLNQAADDVPAEWRALVAGRADDSTLLARLVRQSSPATRQAMLRYFTPDHAHSLLAQLDALQGLLAGLPVSVPLSQSALAAAWQHLLGAALARPTQLPAISPMLDDVIAVLTAELITATPSGSTGAIPEAQRRALVLRQMREVAAELNDPAGLATALMAIERIPGLQDAAPSFAATPSSAVDVASHLSQKLHEQPSAMAAIRSTVSAALTDGKDDDIHDNGEGLENRQSGLSPEAAALMTRTEGSAGLHSSLTTAGADDVPVQARAQAVAAPLAMLAQAESEVPEEWRTLAWHPDDSLLLARLVRQSSPATLQAMMRYFTPDHANALLAQLEALQRLLAGLSVSAQLSQRALAVAWEHLLGAVLARSTHLPATLPMLDEVIAVLTAEPTSTAALPAAQQRTLFLHQMRDAAVVLSAPAGRDTTLAAVAGMQGRQEASMQPSSAAVVSNVELHTPQKLHEQQSMTAPIRSRVTAALSQGKAGDIYDDWHWFQDRQPALLRSAVLHYGGYAEIRDKMAATFPLSLLRDMAFLLSPEAAALTMRIWDDQGLHRRLNSDDAAQWSHWRRGWWRGALAYLLPLAKEQDDRPNAPAQTAFNSRAYVTAALAGTGMTDADDDLSGYVMRLAQDPEPPLRHELTLAAVMPAANEQPAKSSPATSQVPTLTALFEAIRRGAQPLQRSAFNEGQLEQWIREAVREPSFYQAIADHAPLARERRNYYVQVLQALAQNRIVDLEEFAAAEDLALPLQQPQVLALEEPDRPADAADQTTPVESETVSIAPDNSVIAGQRDQAQLISRLAKALMKGDPAALYGDWDSLLHKHAPLLAEALRHYGIRHDILQRIVRSFPESMLYDMAALLAPAALPAWRQLRDPSIWTAALESVSASHQTALSRPEDGSPVPPDVLVSVSPEMLASWKRQLWAAVLHQLLRTEQQNKERSDGDAKVGNSSLIEPISITGIEEIRVLASSLAENAELFQSPWQRRLLDRWVELSVRSELSRQNSAHELPATASGTVPNPIEDDIRAILAHQHVLSGTEKLPEQVRSDLLQRFARLRAASALADLSLPLADMERLVEACIFAHGADDAAHQQRQTFLQAIRTQAPAEPAPGRSHYFKTVLQTLLQEQLLDLEEIAETSKRDHDHIVANKVGDDEIGSLQDNSRQARPAVEEPSAEANDPDSLVYVDFLLSRDFRAGVVLPPGLADWLKSAIDTAAPEIVPMLVSLSRHPEAVARLLELVPVSSWQKLTALPPYSPLQVQRMRRYADDVADLFAEHNRQLSAMELARFTWRFLLPYLFAPDRIFDPVRFTSELVAYLSRESGLSISVALTSGLRSQMGIAVSVPRTTPASAAATEMRGDATLNSAATARRSSNEDTKMSNGRASQSATADDLIEPQMGFGIHVANAGMVLTWPFLSRAWDMLELTRAGKFIDDAAAQRAAWLLQFAVDEQTAVPEYQLTLNKLMCGIPLQAPIVAEIEVMPKERDLLEELLKVMISHWSAIGNTSVQGLRQTFLQREGYLSRKEDGWHLQVPKRTFDMLLDKLPWSISTIRLPWMETILWVEWT